MNNFDIFEKLDALHTQIFQLATKLEALESVPENQRLELLAEMNKVGAPCGAAYGQYTYLFEAAGQKLSEIYHDFWDRIENPKIV